MAKPYQPFLLRLLHGAIAILAILALITGFWVYNTYDRRWGGLPLPKLEDIQGIHGTIALTFFLLLPLFAFYCFHSGYRRLIQDQSLRQLPQWGNPSSWRALQQAVNTLMLLAATGAVITGRMMEEEWLPAGEVNQVWYLAHLMTWLGVLISFLLHLLMGIKVGGMPLLLSMVTLQRRAADKPAQWLQDITLNPPSLVLKVIEGLVFGGIILAFLLPVMAG
ncbi:MAG: cytochrome b/b6 domain-containing protein [Microcystaceae cyanobacterium]